jgi:hypothetical protein
LAQGALSGNATLAKVANYAQRGAEIRTALRKGDKLDAFGGALGVAGMAIGGQTEQTLKNARYGVDVARAVRLVEQGNIAMADKIIASLPLAQQASKTADDIVASRRAALLAAQQPQAPQQASAPAKVETQGIEPQAPVTVSLLVQPGQTLEGIARDEYQENWRAGLALLVIDNRIEFNESDTPILRAGQELVIGHLSGKSPGDLTFLTELGGRIVTNNTKGLQTKAQMEAQAALQAEQARANAAVAFGRSLVSQQDMLAASKAFNNVNPQDLAQLLNSETDSRGIYDPRSTTGFSVVATHDAFRRDSYKAQAQANAKAFMAELDRLPHSQQLMESEVKAMQAFNARQELRTATQKTLSYSGRVVSKVIEQPYEFAERYARYAELEAKKGPYTPRDVHKQIIDASGRTNSGVAAFNKFAKVTGPVGTVLGLGTSVVAIAQAPEGQRGRAVAAETGQFFGSVAGSAIGTAAVGGLALVAAAAGVTVAAPVILIGAAIAGITGAIYLSKVGRDGGERTYDALAK